MGIKVWIALIGVFASFVLLVQGMGYVAFYLSPRDPDAIQRASEFEAVMGSLVRAPEDGVVPVVQADGARDLEAAMADVEIPNRHPEATGAVHRVAEWSGGRLGEAPMLAQRVREGILPPCVGTPAGRSSCYCTAATTWALWWDMDAGLPLVPAMWGLSKPGLRMKGWCGGMRWRRR